LTRKPRLRDEGVPARIAVEAAQRRRYDGHADTGVALDARALQPLESVNRKVTVPLGGGEDELCSEGMLYFMPAAGYDWRSAILSAQVAAMTPIDPADIEWSAVRAQGAGGQNVNKVASAVHLRFDVRASSLPEAIKQRLYARKDRRITADGVIVIKAQRHRTQERNREDALARLQDLVDSAADVPRERKPTRPTRSSQRRRVDSKVRHGQIKAARRRIVE
jgi:ribosome-associated protein